MLVFIAVLLLNSMAWANASLYIGQNIIGTVATIENANANSNLWVSAEDVGARLGFSSSRSGEELILSRANSRIIILMNSAAAWRNGTLISLRAVPFERSGRCWIDAASATAIFQSIVGNDAQNRLRFFQTNSANNPAPVLSSYNQPQAEPALNNTLTTPVILQNLQNSQNNNNSQNTQRPLINNNNLQNSQNTADNPRYETFKPDDNKTQQNTLSPKKAANLDAGEIYRIRWSVTQSQKRIRAVVDANDGATPEVTMLKDGTVHALFASAPENLEGFPAPYTNVNLNVRKYEGGVELIFKAENIKKVEKLVLKSPQRIVFDFFFTPETIIRETAGTSTQNQTVIMPTPIQPVNQNPQTRPTQPVNITPTTPQIQPQTQPQSQTQPAQTSQPVINRLANRLRKTVVVDPGHGGKDPGASANNVREKDVNLAIGLALERELRALGFNVIMTRRTDVYLKLQERTDIANNAKADVFVSVHVNALPSAQKTSGFEIYLMALPTDKDALNLAKIENREYVEGRTVTNNAEVDARTEMLLRILGDMQQNNKINESTELAEALFKAGNNNNLPMKRVAQAPFFVLRGAGMPAVLLETGFVTNATEAKLLSHQGYQERIAKSMAAGVADYLR